MESLHNLSRAQLLVLLLGEARELEKEWIAKGHRPQGVGLFLQRLMSLRQHKEVELQNLAKTAERLQNLESLKQWHDLLVPLERLRGRGLYDHEFLVTTQDKVKENASPIPLTVLVDNLRSAFNVGAILRTAECLGSQRVFLTGYTSTPVESPVKKTAMGAEQYLDWQKEADLDHLVQILGAEGLPLIALETSQRSTSIYDFDFPFPCALILGNEQFGIDPRLLKAADALVEIPMFGRKNSLNVAVAFGICGFEIRRQWQSRALI